MFLGLGGWSSADWIGYSDERVEFSDVLYDAHDGVYTRIREGLADIVMLRQAGMDVLAGSDSEGTTQTNLLSIHTEKNKYHMCGW